jgi:hypothetical protein
MTLYAGNLAVMSGTHGETKPGRETIDVGQRDAVARMAWAIAHRPHRATAWGYRGTIYSWPPSECLCTKGEYEEDG